MTYYLFDRSDYSEMNIFDNEQDLMEDLAGLAETAQDEGRDVPSYMQQTYLVIKGEEINLNVNMNISITLT